MKQFFKVLVSCFLIVMLTACATHRRPAANVVNGNHMGGGQETYTEGLGGRDGSYADNPMCCPAKAIPGKDQRYFFDFDCYDVREEAMDSLKMQADYLINHPRKKVRLEGNTDDRGSREYNIALGWRRAQAVYNILKQFGVPNSQVNMMSYGAEKPVAAGDDERSSQCNRRVDLKYTTD